VDGVDHLHNVAKVAHLDLKLENIMIGDDYQLKIIDFDLSYKLGSNKKCA